MEHGTTLQARLSGHPALGRRAGTHEQHRQCRRGGVYVGEVGGLTGRGGGGVGQPGRIEGFGCDGYLGIGPGFFLGGRVERFDDSIDRQ